MIHDAAGFLTQDSESVVEGLGYDAIFLTPLFDRIISFLVIIRDFTYDPINLPYRV